MNQICILCNLINQNMFGGTISHSGYCDNNPGQCSDSFSGASGTGQCGGGSDQFCDGHPSQCSDLTQQGGCKDFCDGHPSQCGDLTQQGGFIEFKNEEIVTRNQGILSKRDFIKLAKKRSQYKIANNGCTIQQFVGNEVVNILINQKDEQDSSI